MKKAILSVTALFSVSVLFAQKYENIYFHLYTDSLKKGVYNYINVDGKLANGKFLPLGSDEVQFSSSYGKWDGNSLIIDSSYTRDSVVVSAYLKSKPSLKLTTTIFIKKKPDDELPLPSDAQINRPAKRKNRN